MPRQKAIPPAKWANWSDERLLALRLRDLELTIEGTVLERRVAQLYSELEKNGLRVKPHFWLAEEWFSPRGVPGVAIPFYLAHPRLVRLERAQMLEVEGGTHEWCMKLLRHEVGHAVQHAFRLHRRTRWQKLFGKSTKAYPEVYKPRPSSKKYVLHLYYWYAQAHPDEDFAETFAVWLKPRSKWRERYRGWPALKKLEYVDELMAQLAGKLPPVRSRAKPDALPRLHRTLGDHYAERRARYADSHPDLYDRDLNRLFSRSRTPFAPRAGTFLRKHRSKVRRMVSRWTGEHQFTLDQVLRDMMERCDELELYVDRPEEQVLTDFAIVLTVRTMQYFYGRQHEHPL